VVQLLCICGSILAVLYQELMWGSQVVHGELLSVEFLQKWITVWTLGMGLAGWIHTPL